MISESSKLSRGIFLLAFTKELIRNSKSMGIYKLEGILEDKFPAKENKLENLREKIVKKISNKKPEKTFIEKLKEPLPVRRPVFEDVFSLKLTKKPRRVLRIPETRLPYHLQSLKPKRSGEKISLGKLDPFIADGNVKVIECEGAEENILVSGGMGKKPTGIKLSENEIKEIITAFSNQTKIPISEGVTKMVFGDLVLTAIVSAETGSQFVLKKLDLNQRRY